MKKSIILFWFIVATANISYAQFPQELLNSPNQIMVEKSVEKGILIFRQDFQLLDTVANTLYGRNNQEMFGSVYSIAYKLQNVCIVSDMFVCPWKYDENLRKIENNTYIPVISKTQYRDITDSTMKIMNYRSENCKPIVDNITSYTDNINNGFSINKTNGEKDGWIVWIQYAEPLSESTKISIVTHKHKIEFKDGVSEYELKNLNRTENHVCGFYVIPDYSKIGTVEFKFGGVVHKKDNQWILVRINDENECLIEVEDNAQIETMQITPVEDIEVKNLPDNN